MGDLVHIVQELSVLAFLIGSMLAAGLTLTPQAVAAPLRRPRLVVLALGLNFLLAPALAWLLAILIPLQRGHAIGLMLLGGAAGAPFLPKLVDAARGDPALAAALMALLTLGTIGFLPLALPLMVPGLETNPWAIARPLVLLILLPFAVGMLVKSRAAALSARLAPVFAKIGNVSLLLLVVLMIGLNVRALFGVIGSGAILAALLHVAGLLVAGWTSAGRGSESRGVLALATAARNFGAALAPAQNFNDPGVTTMLVVSAVVGIVVTFAAAAWMRRRI
jgi:BASS family bile acid:Na+ symporter